MTLLRAECDTERQLDAKFSFQRKRRGFEADLHCHQGTSLDPWGNFPCSLGKLFSHLKAVDDKLVVQSSPMPSQAPPMRLQIHVSATHTYEGQVNEAHANVTGGKVSDDLR